jgi:hypothetical protein
MQGVGERPGLARDEAVSEVLALADEITREDTRS